MDRETVLVSNYRQQSGTVSLVRSTYPNEMPLVSF